jgi:hypothetical protein
MQYMSGRVLDRGKHNRFVQLKKALGIITAGGHLFYRLTAAPDRLMRFMLAGNARVGKRYFRSSIFFADHLVNRNPCVPEQDRNDQQERNRYADELFQLCIRRYIKFWYSLLNIIGQQE